MPLFAIRSQRMHRMLRTSSITRTSMGKCYILIIMRSKRLDKSSTKRCMTSKGSTSSRSRTLTSQSYLVEQISKCYYLRF